MIARVVATIGVSEVDWRPTFGRVAYITFRSSNKVLIWTLGFTADGRCAVVAGHTVTHNALMIKSTTSKGSRSVAEGTIQRSFYMARAFAGCVNAMA